MKILCFFLALSLFFSHPNTNHTLSPVLLQADSSLIKLKTMKLIADDTLKHHEKEIIVLVKVPGKVNLLRVKGDKWPEEIEYTYNIKKDSTGKIFEIVQMPNSESGDWFLSLAHYFDNNGNTYAFQRNFNVFDSEIKGGVIYETTAKYYDSQFKQLGKNHKVTDINGKRVNDKNTPLDAYNYKYTVYRSLNECLKAYHIKL